jgi:cyclopropane fatty-acyl-phospholipid synthase-like methyltransferase
MKCLDLLNITQNEIVLEIGCGAGALLTEAAEKGATVIGIDISNNQIKYAKSSFPNLFVAVASAEKLPISNGVVSKCFAIEVLEHVQNPDQLLAEIYRVLKDDCELIIVVPNDKNWFINRIIQGNFRDAFYDYGHLHDFSSPKKLASLLTGFKVIKVTRNAVPLIPVLGIMSRLFRSRNKIQKPKYQAKNVIVPVNIHDDMFARFLTLEKRLSLIVPKLTLHLIIKLKKKCRPLL